MFCFFRPLNRLRGNLDLVHVLVIVIKEGERCADEPVHVLCGCGRACPPGSAADRELQARRVLAGRAP